MKKVVFITDFATKKAGDEFICDGTLASQLVRVDKVAEYKKEQPEEQEQNEPPKKAKK